MSTGFFQTIYSSPHINKDDYEDIERAHRKIEIKQGALVLEEGKIAGEYFIIETGLFRSFVIDYTSREVTTEFYSANELLIESFSLFHRLPSMENLQALTDATIWSMTYPHFSFCEAIN